VSKVDCIAGLSTETRIPPRSLLGVLLNACCLVIDGCIMRLGTRTRISPRLPLKKLLRIRCRFHDQVQLAPENKGDDTSSITACDASRFALLLPFWPGNVSSKEQFRYQLQRSPGMASRILLSLSATTAAGHESGDEDTTSIIVRDASHLALLLPSCLANGSLGSQSWYHLQRSPTSLRLGIAGLLAHIYFRWCWYH
jgi:hypothetical protein